MEEKRGLAPRTLDQQLWAGVKEEPFTLLKRARSLGPVPVVQLVEEGLGRLVRRPADGGGGRVEEHPGLPPSHEPGIAVPLYYGPCDGHYGAA